MDLLTLFGVIIAITAISAAEVLDGGHLSQLLSLSAFLVVFGGTLGAVLLQTPLAIFKRSCKVILWVVIPPKHSMESSIEKIFELSRIARKSGLLALEEQVDKEKDEFIKKGLSLIIDAHTPDEIRAALSVELDSEEQRDYNASKVFASMGGYSPTIGILGTVLALIKVMGDISDPTKLSEGIAVAFVATIYGVGFANLLFLPIANKIKTQVNERARLREMLAEGFVGIAEGERPTMLKIRLNGYMSSC